ncbi:RHS repeat-associated core domain-containing protein, partial [Pseudomonas sichuanensis]|uniref:RHS repeat-associated core domain-containing protein n=1 Tax=Pseudomonas sichuanensis TaxID=2213015 RepID=UPI0036ED9EF1
DALGRRLHKHSSARYQDDPRSGSGWNRMQRAKRQRELGCGYTLYGWDGDTLAWESSPPQDEGETGRTVHYLYEPGSFVPVVQALRKAPIRLLRQPDWSSREYDFDQDPLWHTEVKAQPFDLIAWYQCDHLGTPMELTDHNGEVAWTAQYKAWGEAREARSEWARQVGMTNPIRFQGQYHDHETGLHYNRYRYYDPRVGRFINQDLISYAGGINLYSYGDNPVYWSDPLGLAGNPATATHITYRGLDAETGKPYLGYASMQGQQSPEKVLNYRYSSFDRFGGNAPEILYSDYGQQGKDTARGLEQRYYESYESVKKGSTANRQNPVGAQNQRRDEYLAAADLHLSGASKGCPI